MFITSGDVYLYKLASNDDVLVLKVLDDDNIEFEQLPDRYFRVDKKINQLGRAFLEKPACYSGKYTYEKWPTAA